MCKQHSRQYLNLVKVITFTILIDITKAVMSVSLFLIFSPFHSFLLSSSFLNDINIVVFSNVLVKYKLLEIVNFPGVCI